MNPSATLSAHPVAATLERLHADAERTRSDHRPGGGRRPEASSTSAEYWAAFRDVHFAISPDTGRLLYFLARCRRAQSIVEFGTSFGVSAIYLAAALRDNGGGLLIGTEFEASKATAARANLAAAGLHGLADIRVGDAFETLTSELPEPIDLVLLDGAKPVYLDMLRLLEPNLASRAVVVADNAGRAPDYLDYVRSNDQYFSISQLANDVEVTLRSD